MTKAAERELLFLKKAPLETKLHTDFALHGQDETANTLLAHFHASEQTALYSTPNGDCFFNSLSTLLTGDESRSTELRYRCCVEMVLNRSVIMTHPQYKRLTVLCPTLEKDCVTCAQPGTVDAHVYCCFSLLEFTSQGGLSGSEWVKQLQFQSYECPSETTVYRSGKRDIKFNVVKHAVTNKSSNIQKSMVPKSHCPMS